MRLYSASAQTTRQPRLSATDWISAGLEALLERGIDAVQVTVLAQRLNVTRGSFYWHFDSREALLTAMIAEWRARNTGVMVEAVAETETLEDGILALFSVWVDHRRFDARLDQAIRDWARHDDSLRSQVKAEDNARVAVISEFFQRHGYEQPEAFIRARVIYFTQISYYALNIEADEAMADRLGYLEAYFRSFTGRDMAPAVARAYREANLGDRHDD